MEKSTKHNNNNKRTNKMKNLNTQIKTPKHINKLALDLGLHNFDKNLLYVLYKAVHNSYKDQLFLRVDTVSKSGMSRTIECAVIVGDDIINATYLLKELKILDKRGSIRGCGMDMLFEVSYQLFYILHPNKKYQSNLSRYRSY